MTNLEIAWFFGEIADLLEIKENESFKVRAYRQAARTLERLAEDVAVLRMRGEIYKLPGIGKALGQKIEELLDHGSLDYLEQLRKDVPPSLRRMLAIPGLGVKTLRAVYQRLGVKTLEELEQAARSQQIRKLPGLGSKTELNILRGIDLLHRATGSVPLGVSLPVANRIAEDLRGISGVERLELAGDLRRGCELVRQAVLLAAVKGIEAAEKLLDLFPRHPLLRTGTRNSENKACATAWAGFDLELVVVRPAEFVAAWFCLTGSPGHLQALQNLRGYDDDFSRFLERQSGSWLPQTETGIYKRLGLQFIPPELREGGHEVSAALQGDLPNLLQDKDIRGDLHLHTSWSDGVNTVRQVAEAAQSRGYDYIALTDHSRSLGIANGLNEERLSRQQAEIINLEKETGWRIFRGVEVDILADGRLDYPDEILEKAELVIASIHSGFKQQPEQLLFRVEAAMRNPHVDILGHPSGRILGRRPPYALDLDRVLDLAAQTGTALEINASPDRLDLDSEYARRAGERGIPIAIGTDAHDIAHLRDMSYGVTTARRGWLTKRDLLNCLSAEELADWLQRHKEGLNR